MLRTCLMILLSQLLVPAGAEERAKAGPVVAGLVFNVLKYVRFPEGEPDAELRLCVLNDLDEITQGMRSLQGKLLLERPVHVQILAEASALDQCHVVFFSHYDRGVYRYKVQQLSLQPSLTISDLQGFAAAGGGVEIYTEHNKLRLKVNLDAIQRAGLGMAAPLLKVATVLREGGSD